MWCSSRNTAATTRCAALKIKDIRILDKNAAAAVLKAEAARVAQWNKALDAAK